MPENQKLMPSGIESAAHIDGMSNDTRRKNAGLPGNGGKFAANGRNEASQGLFAPLHKVDLDGIEIEFTTSYLEELPTLPDGLGAPTVQWSYQGSEVNVCVTIDGEAVTVWGDSEESYNSLSAYSDEPSAPWGDNTDAVVDYATALFHRVNLLTLQVAEATHARTHDTILSSALGKPAADDEPEEPQPRQVGTSSEWASDLGIKTYSF